MEALGRLHLTVSRAYRVNPEINFEVFIHKVDGLSDDHKIETQRDIHQRANDDLADASLEKLHLRYFLMFYYFTPRFKGEKKSLLSVHCFYRHVVILTHKYMQTPFSNLTPVKHTFSFSFIIVSHYCITAKPSLFLLLHYDNTPKSCVFVHFTSSRRHFVLYCLIKK